MLSHTTRILRSSLHSRAMQIPTKSFHTLTRATMNQNIVGASYAVRGPIVTRAGELKRQLEHGDEKLEFDKVVFCNIGNPQSLGAPPISFFRQVAAACNLPALAEKPNEFIPEDARARALHYLRSTDGSSVGAYTHSQGLSAVREDVAKFLETRDGVSCPVDDIFLTDGASAGIKNILQMLIANDKAGIMLPIPQYPLYSASIDMCGGRQVPYYLDEQSGWAMEVTELERALEEARAKGTEVRAICVINPGNPTGASLSEENVRDVIHFARNNRLVILADEVYQENIYDTSTPFVSFRKVLHSMGSEDRKVELFSFHSTSKGILGECGYRGGFMALDNIDPFTYSQIYKMASVSLCPNVTGQVMTGLMCNPPKEGDPSYAQYQEEVVAQFNSLQRRAKKTTEALNSVPGLECQKVTGALYAFPKITLPSGAVHEAYREGMEPDAYFAMELLQHTGVCVVPGSGFGQEDGTYHFRTTILPPEEEMDAVLNSVLSFYKRFCARYE